MTSFPFCSPSITPRLHKGVQQHGQVAYKARFVLLAILVFALCAQLLVSQLESGSEPKMLSQLV